MWYWWFLSTFMWISHDFGWFFATRGYHGDETRDWDSWRREKWINKWKSFEYFPIKDIDEFPSSCLRRRSLLLFCDVTRNLVSLRKVASSSAVKCSLDREICLSVSQIQTNRQIVKQADIRIAFNQLESFPRMKYNNQVITKRYSSVFEEKNQKL